MAHKSSHSNEKKWINNHPHRDALWDIGVLFDRMTLFGLVTTSDSRCVYFGLYHSTIMSNDSENDDPIWFDYISMNIEQLHIEYNDEV